MDDVSSIVCVDLYKGGGGEKAKGPTLSLATPYSLKLEKKGKTKLLGRVESSPFNMGHKGRPPHSFNTVVKAFDFGWLIPSNGERDAAIALYYIHTDS